MTLAYDRLGSDVPPGSNYWIIENKLNGLKMQLLSGRGVRKIFPTSDDIFQCDGRQKMALRALLFNKSSTFMK